MVLSECQARAAGTSRPFAGDPGTWDRVVDRARAAAARGEELGLDTEFHGQDPSKGSCVGTARVHVWSLAVFNGRVSPRGHRSAGGVTLPAEALNHPPVRDLLEDPAVTKVAHNLPVDHHALGNHGVQLAGAVNSLSVARWVWPGRGGYGLKELMPALLGRRPLGDFTQLICEPNVQFRTKVTRTRTCDCGTPGCRLRKGHQKTEVVTETREFWIPKNQPTRPVPLEEIVPGHWLWGVLVPYAAEDAEAALELWDAARLAGRGTPVELPW